MKEKRVLKKKIKRSVRLKYKTYLNRCVAIDNPFEEECMSFFGYQKEYKGQYC